ncbi:MAG: RpiB/LacA/LacB family sugar-phosphate isomerase [Bifidobacteriaceae bacterium]|nr:RpiB/LacA/LacB family sugar-phosphate isomerase [Bifidobacteriaceae bacterium]
MTPRTFPAWRIGIGADDAGYSYKETIKLDLEASPLVDAVRDFGVAADGHDAYGLVAANVGEAIRAGEFDRGLLICGTGLGMAIAANKIPDIRAAAAHDSFSVERLVKSNNAQILCLGQRVLGIELARRLVAEWLTYRFDPTSASAAKVAVISAYEGRLAAGAPGRQACG